jgi:hypothetical protein
MKGARRFGIAMTVGVLATVGLIPATSASGGTGMAAGGAASAAAAPRSSRCNWTPVPAKYWVLDPAASPVGLIGGRYGTPGTRHVAYKITGPFAHSTTQVFTSYDNLIDIPGANYTLNDSDIIPDAGSVNPFVPGTRVMAPNRNQTVYVWPDDTPVPAGLKNVVLYPTAAYPGSGEGPNPRWSMALRLYHMQPGYSTLAALRSLRITAVSATNPSQEVRCALPPPPGAFLLELTSFVTHLRFWGGIPKPAEPATGNKIYFTRMPAVQFLGLDGYPGPIPQSCMNYMLATLPEDKLSVITMHRVAENFNNNQVTPASIMKDYPIRYQSQTATLFTSSTALYDSVSTNTSDGLITSDRKWVTVWLPANPRLPAAQERAVRAKAAANNWNVVQMSPKPQPWQVINNRLPWPSIAVRQKGISPNFPYSNLAMPCWSEDHDYRTYAQQNSPEFFAKYASSPRNMGPYYVDGLKQTFGEFMGS